MDHYPIFLNVRTKRIVVSGAGETAVAKLRLLLKTTAEICVYGERPHADITAWSAEGRLRLVPRAIAEGDAAGASLFYAANDDEAEDARAAAVGRAAGALVNVVDNFEASAFLTPAIVDRDPVTVAIGTEGAAPVLARRIKAAIEEQLPPSLGILARIARSFRHRAEMLPQGRKRRAFWGRFYDGEGQRAFAEGGEAAVRNTLETLLTDAIENREKPGSVALIGTGPGNPELLTLMARRILHEADVVLHDRLVPQAILELARREALIIETGKTGYGESWSQEDINALMIRHAGNGARVARLKSGDPAIFGRLDEELDALDAAGIAFEVVPGITSASAAAASMGASLTRRGRNSSLRILTGREVEGFAEHDWRDLALPGATAAIYMGVRAAHFIQGRLMAHGARSDTPVTIVENASRPDQRTLGVTLSGLTAAISAERINGPAILLYGMAPRRAATDRAVAQASTAPYRAPALSGAN